MIKCTAVAGAARRHGERQLVVYGLLMLVFALPVAAQHQFITIGTGPATGVYFQVGNALCRMVHQAAADGGDHHIRCSAPATGGSIDNLLRMAAGELDFAIVQSDWQFHAYQGSSQFAGRKLEHIRALFSLHPEPFQLLAGSNTNIQGPPDFKGKRVNVGRAGSGQSATFDELLRANGVDRSLFGRATGLSAVEQAKALCEGRIDAYGYTIGIPNLEVRKTISNCGATLIGLNRNVVDKLVSDRSYYEAVTIPQGTYPQMSGDVLTFGVVATLVTLSETDENLVYELVRAVFGNVDRLREMYPALADLDPRRMACRGLSAPLHRGASRYFAEAAIGECR
jgi:TRAP transporter TAXI family solute receptor